VSGSGSSRAGGLDRWLRELRRAVVWRRRLLAAGLLAGSVAFGLQVLAPPPPPGVPVLVAARDVAAGTVLAAPDVRRVQRPAGTLPTRVLTSTRQAAGATVSSAVRRGEVLTDVRLAGTGSLQGLGRDLVAAPVRLADDATAGLLRPGDVVDVLAAGADGAAEARLVASAVRVLVVPRTTPDRLGLASGDGALLLLATTPSSAARLAAATVTDRLSVVIRAQ
jgi:Flp pilus assembly protein CpaB